MATTQRYEVTMTDGWKVRLNATDAEQAKAKAESMNRYGDKAISAVPCEELAVAER